jgi:hypothetical protein
MTVEELRVLVRDQCREHMKPKKNSTGLSGWCLEHGLSKGQVSEFLNGARSPPPKMLDALGLEWRIVRKSDG